MSGNRLSKYVRWFPQDGDDGILYNSRNRAVLTMDKEFINWPFVSSSCPPDYIEVLDNYEFFNESVNSLHEDEEGKLVISIETMLACNLSCPYCYQRGGYSKNTLSQEAIESLMIYLEKVYDRTHFHTLTLKLLGGEPALRWDIITRILQPIRVFSKNNSVSLNIMFDTNATLIDNYLSLSDYDSLLFTVPLTYKDCHNESRYYHNGKGTYDDILDNLNSLHDQLSNASLVLRYNVDAENIGYFEPFIQDIKRRLCFSPVISPNYTMNLGDNTYKNTLKHCDFIHWLSTDCIDILAKNDLKITVTPYTLSDKCQYWSKYSIKLFSDGTVGACAMNFFAHKRPKIGELADNIDKVLDYWDGAKQFSINNEENCLSCDSLFLCGATYHLPCIMSLNIPQCQADGLQHIELLPFLTRYLYYCEQGKRDLFVGFNDFNLYK